MPDRKTPPFMPPPADPEDDAEAVRPESTPVFDDDRDEADDGAGALPPETVRHEEPPTITTPAGPRPVVAEPRTPGEAPPAPTHTTFQYHHPAHGWLPAEEEPPANPDMNPPPGYHHVRITLPDGTQQVKTHRREGAQFGQVRRTKAYGTGERD